MHRNGRIAKRGSSFRVPSLDFANCEAGRGWSNWVGQAPPWPKRRTPNAKRQTQTFLVARVPSLCNVVGPMEAPKLQIALLTDSLAVCRLQPDSVLPDWAMAGGFCSATRTADGLTVICRTDRVPADVHASRGWRALKIEGPLDLNLVGILVSVAAPLAQAGIAILPVGSYETDYILVRNEQLDTAIRALKSTSLDVVEDV